MIVINSIPDKLSDSIKEIADKIFHFFAWNFVLTFILSNYFPLVMFTMLHYTTAPVESLNQPLNTIILIICSILLMLPGLTAFLTYSNFKKNHTENKKIPNKQINVLLSSFKQNSLITILYPTISLIKGFIIFSSLVCLRDYPKITLIIWLFTSFLILIFLIIFRPFGNVMHTVNKIGCECFTIIMYLMAAKQAELDQNDVDKKSDLGFIMLKVNDGFCIWMTLFSYLGLAFLVIETIIKGIKNRNEEEKSKINELNPEDVEVSLKENSFDENISSDIDSQDNNYEVFN